MWFYLNGRFVEDEDAKVSVTDHSFLYGDGCFEGIESLRRAGDAPQRACG